MNSYNVWSDVLGFIIHVNSDRFISHRNIIREIYFYLL